MSASLCRMTDPVHAHERRTPWSSSASVLAGLAVILAGCTTADNDATEDPDVPHTTLSVDHYIGGGGGGDAEPEHEFGAISGVTLLDNGRIAVVDRMNHLVRVHERDGTLAFSFGRNGAGPGEFDGPCCPAVGPGGRLWVRDGGNARYTAFATHADRADHAGQIRMSHQDVNRWAPLTFDDDGRLIDIGARSEPQSGMIRVYRMHVDSAGGVLSETPLHTVPDDSTSVRKVRRDSPGGTTTLFGYQPYGPVELTAHSPKRAEFAHALSRRYAVEWRAADGALIRAITRNIPHGPALSAREDSVGGARLDQLAVRFDMPRRQLGFDVPARKPPLRSLFFDSDGRLWVELAVGDGEDRRADVYDSDGTLLRTVSWPAAISLSDGAVRGTDAWGVATDALGVMSLVRLTGL
ncbi:MAG: hypothetical protein KFH98_14375 [Gemmatimonadetes bacterium]|nr:hypothetical protein [Gemmatimonadota bacterium]